MKIIESSVVMYLSQLTDFKESRERYRWNPLINTRLQCLLTFEQTQSVRTHGLLKHVFTMRFNKTCKYT